MGKNLFGEKCFFPIPLFPKLWVKRQETTVLTAYYQYEFRVIARKP